MCAEPFTPQRPVGELHWLFQDSAGSGEGEEVVQEGGIPVWGRVGLWAGRAWTHNYRTACMSCPSLTHSILQYSFFSLEESKQEKIGTVVLFLLYHCYSSVAETAGSHSNWGEHQNIKVLCPVSLSYLDGRQNNFPLSLLLASSHLPSNVQMNRLCRV